jgi:hypothetical protein
MSKIDKFHNPYEKNSWPVLENNYYYYQGILMGHTTPFIRCAENKLNRDKKKIIHSVNYLCHTSAGLRTVL